MLAEVPCPAFLNCLRSADNSESDFKKKSKQQYLLYVS